MADRRAFCKVAEWLQKDNSIQAVVVSAGGKTSKCKKVTDILIESANKIEKGESVYKSLLPFFDRVKFNAESVGVYNKIKDELMKIEQEVERGFSLDFILSRGEFIYAQMFSHFIGVRFVDSKDLIYFYDDGLVNLGYTEFKIKEEYEKNGRFITGGFYGGYRNGRIKTFSRGGSDFSGAIVARSLMADEYLNFTDVDGIYSFNPSITSKVEIIKEINFDTVRLLGEFGAGVLHPASVLPLYGTGIQIRLKNTFNKTAEGTVIKENTNETPFAVAMKPCRFIRLRKRGEGYKLLQNFTAENEEIVFAICNLDQVDVCFLGETAGEEIAKRTGADYLAEEDKSVVFYFSKNEKSSNIIEILRKEGVIKGETAGKFGRYVCLAEKWAKKVIELL